MKADIRFDSDAAIVAFLDEGASFEARTRNAAEAEPLRDRTRAGEAFVAETEDPWLRNFSVYLDQPVPQEIEEAGTNRSGAFLLHLPSGRLRVVALGTGSSKTDEPPETRTLDVPPGDYSLSLLDGSTLDVEAIRAREKPLVDAADWRLYERINHFGAAGCLTIALGMIFVLIPYTRREYWFLLPLFLLPTCAYTFLRRLPGYARVSERIREYEASLPQYVVAMKRVEATEGLEGGWYQCK